jgi:hypothetical protein
MEAVQIYIQRHHYKHINLFFYSPPKQINTNLTRYSERSYGALSLRKLPQRRLPRQITGVGVVVVFVAIDI